MTSIARSASKPVKDRRVSDLIRIQAGHMLTFDDLSSRDDVAERHIMRKVVRKNVLRNAGCMNLPISLAYFFSFVLSARVHEDVTNVFLVESEIRGNVDNMFGEVAKIEDLWEVLLSPEEGNFIPYFFNQEDAYGDPLSKGSGSDLFGSWGRVEKYNQLQGAIRFEQTRRGSADYGEVPYDCQSSITCRLCEENAGFQQVKVDTNAFNFSDQCHGAGRRMEGSGSPRRLMLNSGPMRTSLPAMTEEAGDRFRFQVFPAEAQQEIRERLTYFRERKWLDADTEVLWITMNVLNAELGRPRLERVRLRFFFASTGGIRYERDLQSLFLETWPQPRITAILVDVVFVLILLSATVERSIKLYNAYSKRAVCEHFMNAYTCWEWIIIFWGWFNVYGIYHLVVIAGEMKEALQEVRSLHWTSGPELEAASNGLFDATGDAVDFVGRNRYLLAMYAVALIMRFFVSFGAQPRLALAVNTMRAVLTDIFHFFLIFAPTFMSFVIAGTLLFGRRLEGFVDVTSSIMSCFRIVIESEYDWRELTEEHYFTSAIWVWSFMLLVVMVMLNTVLAIIFDMYNEVREGAMSSEAVWDTIWHLLLRVFYTRRWVKDKHIEERLHDTLTQPMVHRQDLVKEFPNIPDQQADLLYAQCKKDMVWEASKDLDKRNLVKLTGAIMYTVDKANKTVNYINKEESDDPLKSWVQPAAALASPILQELDENFLTTPVMTKGGLAPKVQPAGEDDDGDEDSQEPIPAWLREVNDLLTSQKTWMDHATWQMEQMQWQMQMAHMSRVSGLPPSGLGIGDGEPQVL